SGMPHSVERPAPVNGAMTRARSTKSCSSSMAVSRSGAIMYAASVPCLADAKEVTHEISAHHAARGQPRSGARLLLQEAGSQGGAPTGRREEPLYAGVSGRARG